MLETTSTPLRLTQLLDERGRRRVARVVDRDRVQLLDGEATIYAMATDAIRLGTSLAEAVSARAAGEVVTLPEIAAEERLLPPLDHPDPSHLIVSGTGLTHLGSADARNRMHAMKPEDMTDSMRMFRSGVEGGRPAPGEVGEQPEWFFKGLGGSVVASERPLTMPGFALDGGEEPEVAGLYVVAPDGTPWRVGFALANEFADHVLEKTNYLLLAHSKLRPCAVGPEMLVGPLPPSVRGTSRIRRDGSVIWEKEFLTGEENMSHTLANLEHHHFKYDLFRRAGDAHVHLFGTATLSFQDGVRCRPGDVFEIEADAFVLPLRNRLAQAPEGGYFAAHEL